MLSVVVSRVSPVQAIIIILGQPVYLLPWARLDCDRAINLKQTHAFSIFLLDEHTGP